MVAQPVHRERPTRKPRARHQARATHVRHWPSARGRRRPHRGNRRRPRPRHTQRYPQASTSDYPIESGSDSWTPEDHWRGRVIGDFVVASGREPMARVGCASSMPCSAPMWRVRSRAVPSTSARSPGLQQGLGRHRRPRPARDFTGRAPWAIGASRRSSSPITTPRKEVSPGDRRRGPSPASLGVLGWSLSHPDGGDHDAKATYAPVDNATNRSAHAAQRRRGGRRGDQARTVSKRSTFAAPAFLQARRSFSRRHRRRAEDPATAR